jgi:membrane-bound lytic murein transglycosylase D
MRLVLLIILFLSFTTTKAQDSIQVANQTLKKDSLKFTDNQLKSGETYAIDTIIDGRAVFKKIEVIKPIVNNELDDDDFAANIDQKWLDELYSSSLYDTIYKSVSDLKYDEVYYPELSTDTLKARLKRLNARTPFNVEYNPSLESVIKSYLKNRRQTLERLMALSEYYFPTFERELDNQNIPLEIKYLAIVESALKPKAKSRVGATGLWQFMFATGKQFGLDVSSYVDERSDPIKSTVAASKYLASLYRIFGDWDLALAAYNSGPGNVSKAIRRSGGYKNYWNIRPFLPRETAGYLPAFLATMYIFEYAEEHGFKPNQPNYRHIETDTIHVKQMITLDQVSEMTGVKIEELQFLNPSYKLDIIPFIKGENYTLCLPKSAVGKFVNNEEQIYAFAKSEFEKREKPLPEFTEAKTQIRYRVKSGDYLGKIARRYGVRVSDLKRWNGLRSNNLRIGQRLSIYPRRPHTTTSKITVKKTAKKTPTGTPETYIVKSGDTLWSISQKFSGVSIQDLKDWNDISGSKLRPGMKLKIYKG